jgi:hypothetical protein
MAQILVGIKSKFILSPSIRKFGNEFTYSGLSAACDELSRAE